MDQQEFTLQYEPTGSSTDGRWAQRFQREVWDVLMDVFQQYLMEEQGVWPYLREVTLRAVSEEWWTTEDGTLRFRFPTHGGERVRSAAAFAHWSRLAAALRWRTLTGVADHSEARLVGDRPDLRTMLESPEQLFVTHEDETWLVEADGSLLSDVSRLTPEDVDADTRELVEKSIEEQRCHCRLCARLRPDSEIEEQWRAELSSGDPAEARSAAAFLLQTVEPSTEAIFDLAGAADHSSSYRHTRAMFDMGKRLDPSRLHDLRTAIEDTEEPRTQAALIACVAGLATAPDKRTSVLMDYFPTEPPAAETAVEFLGYGEVPSDRRVELAERLAGCIGQYHDLDYAVALTLYNLFREEDYPPSVVKETLRELSRQSGEQADVAQRALDWFEKR